MAENEANKKNVLIIYILNYRSLSTQSFRTSYENDCTGVLQVFFITCLQVFFFFVEEYIWRGSRGIVEKTVSKKSRKFTFFLLFHLLEFFNNATNQKSNGGNGGCKFFFSLSLYVVQIFGFQESVTSSFYSWKWGEIYQTIGQTFAVMVTGKSENHL